ncbi:MAG TPA: hypothetical protein VFY73_01870 [Ideonella sp.]|uniref:hypothetical protein n=1 Tax=Ideonella sp. TaxID=1929293 RepID=UPI002E3627CD|nr:hypothetical protein [Ideonella sp.]HEX5682757.1 hypothetical protein [Ideonella sp.]
MKLNPDEQRRQLIAAINDRHGTEITRAKDQYEALHASGASVDDLLAAARPLLEMTPMTPIIIGPGQLSLYRVRAFDPAAACETTRALSYPPPGVAGMGRANRAGHSGALRCDESSRCDQGGEG